MNETNYIENNKVFLKGKILTPPVYSHELYGEGFYELSLEVPRLSEIVDRIPITVSERIMKEADLSVGNIIAVNGQFRSYNKIEESKSKLMLTVFARDFVSADTCENNPNVISLSGYICKPPIYRTTPFNREICDLLLAVNRAYNKSDYLPCIAWGRNARFVKSCEIGEKIVIEGRIQSREYVKKISETEVITRICYEISINKIGMESAGTRETLQAP